MTGAGRRLASVAGAVAGVAALGPSAQGERPSAQGERATGPIAVAACSQNVVGPCSEAGKVSLPGNGYGNQSTDTVPTHTTDAGAQLRILSPSDPMAFDSTWVEVVEHFPSFAKVRSTFVRRVITCSLLAAGSADAASIEGVTFTEKIQTYHDAYQMGVAVCLRAVLAQPAPPPAASSAAPCQAQTSVPLEVARARGGYKVIIAGPTFTPTRPSPLKVSCHRTTDGLAIDLRPRAKGHKLRPLLGPKFSLGFWNPTMTPEAIRTTFTFT